MYTTIEFAVLVFLYNTKVIDAWTFASLVSNGVAQYSGIVGTELLRNTYPSPKVLFTPVQGIVIAAKYVRMAKDPVERSARITTLGSYVMLSATNLFNTNTNQNVVIGATIHAFIRYMGKKIMSNITKTDKSVFCYYGRRQISNQPTATEWIVFYVIIIGGVLCIKVIYLVIKKVLVCSWHRFKNWRASKKLSKHIISFDKRRCDKNILMPVKSRSCLFFNNTKENRIAYLYGVLYYIVLRNKYRLVRNKISELT
jgi:hypothetical protein